MEELGILDTEFVVSNALSGATEAAIGVLRIDDVLWARDGPKYTRLGEFRGLAPEIPLSISSTIDSRSKRGLHPHFSLPPSRLLSRAMSQHTPVPTSGTKSQVNPSTRSEIAFASSSAENERRGCCSLPSNRPEDRLLHP